MRIVIISEQEADFDLVERLLLAMTDVSCELVRCPADAAVLAVHDLSRFHLMLWGRISHVQVAAQVLMEMSRQQVGLPLIILSDKAADIRGMEQEEGAPPRDFEVLSRHHLTVPVLRSALLHYGAKRKSAANQPARIPDPLTGLGNRQHLREQVAKQLARDTEPGAVALLLIDVDQFKKVNRSYGQGAGDALIQLIAERLQNDLPPGLHLTRIGGDEFGLVMSNSVGSVEAEAGLRAEAMLEAMTKPFVLARQSVRISVSMGLAVREAGHVTVDTLFAQADMAMRSAKAEPGNSWQRYTREMTESAQKELRLESEIRRSLRKDEFVLHYQPRVDISRNTIVGVEALVRWQHPARGLLPPGAFIPAAEESGLIVPLGYWVIHAACKFLNDLSEKGFGHIDVAVNVAFKQFQDKNFVRTVANILRKHNIGPGRLEFELTETTMMLEGSAVDQSLRELSELGIAISLDDFGTGYSSFAHIQRLPISALKVDRSFVRNVSHNVDDATIVKAMISLAHSLNMRVIAEGAETLDQVDFLRQYQCDHVQGYYFSKPVPTDDLIVLLQSGLEKQTETAVTG